jgi:hypothetical protein
MPVWAGMVDWHDGLAWRANGNPWRGKNALVQTLNLARLSHGKSRSAAYAVAQHPAWFTVQTIHIACIVRVS